MLAFSVTSTENITLGGDDASTKATMSSDGRYVVFTSIATNLVEGDTNGYRDIFVRDTQTNTTVRASVSSAGVQGNGESYDPSISANGHYVTFVSYSTNLVDGDDNGVVDIFVYDIRTGVTSRVNLTNSGDAPNSYSDYPTISDDGRYVAFVSNASNLVDGDTDGSDDIFYRDTQTSVTTRVSVSEGGTQPNNPVGNPVVSADGRYVFFVSSASNLTDTDTNDESNDVFMRDMQANTLSIVSLATSGAQGNSDTYLGGVSADGKYISLSSNATNLVDNDTNGTSDVFVRDLVNNTTTLASVNTSGGIANGYSYASNGSISAHGRYVIFESDATDLVSGDDNGYRDVFVRDLQTNTTTRVAEGTDITNDYNEGFVAAISGAGNAVTYDNYIDPEVDVPTVYYAKLDAEQDSSTSSNTSGKKIRKSSKCFYSKPDLTSWIKIEPTVKNGVSGINITWVQHTANKIDIKIDDGSGKYPWTISRTKNDGHEFLPNVSAGQKVKIKPYNHCKAGTPTDGVSFSMFPNGWFK